MNWLTNFVRPRLQALVSKKEVPDNLWRQCPSCSAMLFHRELEENLQVCRHCGHHMRIDPVKRLKLMYDEETYRSMDLPKTITDPLHFRDQKRYTDRIKESRAKTGRQDAFIIAKGKIGGRTVITGIFDFSFMGGSMGIAVGESIVAAANLAVAEKAPLILIPASGGARMQEGILSLMQLPRTLIAVERVKAAGLPYIVLLTDPTTGGVSASFAMVGDIHISEPGAIIGFAGARVIENTIREKLPEGFQRAEYLREHGMVDMVVPRAEIRDTLVRIFGLLQPPEIKTGKGRAVAALPGGRGK